MLEACKTNLGADYPNILISMGNLAMVLGKRGLQEEAEKLELEVLEACKTNLGVDHPNTLTAMYNLAFIWYDCGRIDDALVLMKDCYDLR